MKSYRPRKCTCSNPIAFPIGNDIGFEQLHFLGFPKFLIGNVIGFPLKNPIQNPIGNP